MEIYVKIRDRTNLPTIKELAEFMWNKGLSFSRLAFDYQLKNCEEVRLSWDKWLDDPRWDKTKKAQEYVYIECFWKKRNEHHLIVIDTEKINGEKVPDHVFVDRRAVYRAALMLAERGNGFIEESGLRFSVDEFRRAKKEYIETSFSEANEKSLSEVAKLEGFKSDCYDPTNDSKSTFVRENRKYTGYVNYSQVNPKEHNLVGIYVKVRDRTNLPTIKELAEFMWNKGLSFSWYRDDYFLQNCNEIALSWDKWLDDPRWDELTKKEEYIYFECFWDGRNGYYLIIIFMKEDPVFVDRRAVYRAALMLADRGGGFIEVDGLKFTVEEFRKAKGEYIETSFSDAVERSLSEIARRQKS